MRIILIIKVVCSLQTQTALSTEIGMNPSDIYPSPHFSFRPLVLTIAFLFAGMNGAAATEDSTPKATYIDTQPIVVTATRTT